MIGSGYPILLNLRGRLVVIVGGGKVAARKVRGLLESGADSVRVVSPEMDPSIVPPAERIQQRYRSEHIGGATLVFAATDSPAVNDQVVRDARAIGAWVNRADDHDESMSDFSTPATHRDGAIVLTVSARGNPAIATRVRDAAVGMIDPRLVKMASAMSELRPAIRSAKTLSPADRREIFVWLSSDEAINLLEMWGMVRLRNEVERRLKEPSPRPSAGVPGERG